MDIKSTYLNFNKFLKKKYTSFLILLSSYILILIIPIITTLFICGCYQAAMLHQQEEQNNNYFETISSNITYAITDIRELYSYIINYDDLNELMSLNTPFEYSISDNVARFLNPIYRISSKSIDTFFIYMPDSDTILAKNAICDSNYYYKAFFGNTTMSYNRWIDNIVKVSPTSFISYYYDENKGVKLLYRLAITDNSGKQMIMCAILNDELFFGNTPMVNKLLPIDVYISNADGAIISSHLNLGKNITADNISDINALYGKKYNITQKDVYVDATLLNVTFVYSTRSNNVLMSRVLKISIALILVCIILCVFLIIYFCTRHFTPVAEFLRLLDIHSSKNEYTHIYRNIKNILNENMQYSCQSDTLKSRQRKLILSKYIIGDYSPSYIESALKANNIDFKYDNLAVCIFQIYNLSSLFSDTPEISEEEKYNELLFIIDNIFTELFDVPGCACDIVDSGGYIFCILNSSESPQQIAAVIENTMDLGINSIMDNFGVKLDYTVSATNHIGSELSIACNEAMYLINYKRMIDIDYPLYYSSYKNNTASIEHFFPFEVEQTLINYISNGQEEKADKCIDGIFKNMREATLTLENTRCILIDLALIFFKIPTIELSKEEQNSIFNNVFALSDNLSEMKTFLCNTISDICQRMDISSGDYKDQRLNRLSKFINDNFTNPEFSLTFIGEEFHLDSGYLSKQFKEKNGIGIIDYVNKLRINRAKELLNDSQYKKESIENIAKKVGYSNIRTFNRIFTKSEGILPSAYKKSRI